MKRRGVLSRGKNDVEALLMVVVDVGVWGVDPLFPLVVAGAAITCASMALAHSGVEMFDLVGSCTVGRSLAGEW